MGEGLNLLELDPTPFQMNFPVVNFDFIYGSQISQTQYLIHDRKSPNPNRYHREQSM